jgi:hypothetical protein
MIFIDLSSNSLTFLSSPIIYEVHPIKFLILKFKDLVSSLLGSDLFGAYVLVLATYVSRLEGCIPVSVSPLYIESG